MSSLAEKGWWSVPAYFNDPLVFHMEEDQEEHIFGPGDTYLCCIEEHSQTLIQLESWFTGTGQTWVTVVGPVRARHWLMNMVRSLGSRDFYHQARGLEMLRRVRSQPLTSCDLDSSTMLQPDTRDMTCIVRMIGTISLEVPQHSLGSFLGCFGFHWSLLYP